MPKTPLEILLFITIFVIYIYYKREEFKKILPVSKKEVRKIDDEIREGFTDLVDLLVHNTEKDDLSNFISTLQPKTSPSKENLKENHALSFLQEIVCYVEKKGSGFIAYIDWKEAVSDVIWKINNALGKLDKETDLLTFIDDPGNMPISAANAFSDINSHLTQFGIQMAYIDDFSDGYNIILHNLENQASVESAIKKIGLPYKKAIV